MRVCSEYAFAKLSGIIIIFPYVLLLTYKSISILKCYFLVDDISI